MNESRGIERELVELIAAGDRAIAHTCATIETAGDDPRHRDSVRILKSQLGDLQRRRDSLASRLNELRAAVNN